MTGSRYAELLHTYMELLGIEERLLSALIASHSTHSHQYKRQRNRVETFRRQVDELQRLADEQRPS